LPLDYDTLIFLIKETISNALEDTNDKLNELAIKYKVKIIAKPPILVKVEQKDKGELIWEK